VANWARHLGIEPEAALRQASSRFARRFRALEALSHERGWDLAQITADDLEHLWQEAKSQILE
jgi:ATP diphosphatase